MLGLKLTYGENIAQSFHWKPRVVIMSTLLPVLAQEVVFMTTFGASCDDKVGIMATVGFHCQMTHQQVEMFHHVLVLSS